MATALPQPDTLPDKPTCPVCGLATDPEAETLNQSGSHFAVVNCLGAALRRIAELEGGAR